MYIIADHRIPQEAKTRLNEFGELLFLETGGISYPAISGHPDVFFCRTPTGLVIAPNTPENFKQQLRENKIDFVEGASRVGEKYPETAHYNAVVTDELLIHHSQHTDPVVANACATLQSIQVNQAYTRCNLVTLENNRFITSDKGIEKTLYNEGFEVLFVHPAGILLPGFVHGFIGGCCGISKNSIFFTGSLNHFPEGDKIRNFVNGMEIVELYDGPLFDGGSLIFI